MMGHLSLIEAIEVQPGGHPTGHVLHILCAQLVEVSQEAGQVLRKVLLRGRHHLLKRLARHRRPESLQQRLGSLPRPFPALLSRRSRRRRGSVQRGRDLLHLLGKTRAQDEEVVDPLDGPLVAQHAVLEAAVQEVGVGS